MRTALRFLTDFDSTTCASIAIRLWVQLHDQSVPLPMDDNGHKIRFGMISRYRVRTVTFAGPTQFPGDYNAERCTRIIYDRSSHCRWKCHIRTRIFVPKTWPPTSCSRNAHHRVIRLSSVTGVKIFSDFHVRVALVRSVIILTRNLRLQNSLGVNKIYSIWNDQ